MVFFSNTQMYICVTAFPFVYVAILLFFGERAYTWFDTNPIWNFMWRLTYPLCFVQIVFNDMTNPAKSNTRIDLLVINLVMMVLSGYFIVKHMTNRHYGNLANFHFVLTVSIFCTSCVGTMKFF